MIHVHEVIAFAVATFGESINPGPTLTALVQARTRSWQEAWGVVIGVALANIVWVIIVVLLKSFASELPSWPEAQPLLKAFAALILVFIATRAAAWAAITGTETYILRNWTTPLATAPAIGARSFAGGVRRGFVVHFLNPLSLTYYLGAYSGALASNPSLALIFAVVAVFVDFLVYGILASIPVERLLRPSPTAFAARRIFALLASFAMLFLVAHVFAIDRSQQAPGELYGLRDLLMLLGFLAGTIWEAENFAFKYGKTKNRLLWRGILVWQSGFGAIAIIGTILSVLVRIDPDSFGIDKSLISAMAICSLVAAVVTAALSYARARGEMLDEAQIACDAGRTQNLTRTKSLNGPKVVFPVIVIGFLLLFAFFVASGFSK
jgi:threonine/homoserine/homoserine lactone efflux protein